MSRYALIFKRALDATERARLKSLFRDAGRVWMQDEQCWVLSTNEDPAMFRIRLQEAFGEVYDGLMVWAES
jgi:hypothetical protein